MRAVLLSHEFADPAKRGKLRALAGLGVTVAAAAPARWMPGGNGTAHVTAFGDDAGVQVTPIAVRGPLDDPMRLRWSAKAVGRLLSEFRPDIVQVEAEPWTAAAAAAVSAARRLKIPAVVATQQSLRRGYGFAERLRRDRVLRRTDALIAANTIAASLATHQKPTLRTFVIPPYGVTPPQLSPREPQPALSIGFLGRLVPERGLDLLFRACVNLPGPWTVTVVGTGPSQEMLEALAERLGVAARVTWLGALTLQAIETVWPTLDCVVFPSRTAERWVDSLGRMALEAMAHGLAVVVSDSGALPELVGDAGRIVPEDDVPALAAALQALLLDRELCQHLGTLGRQRVLEQFSETAIAGRTIALWRDLVGAAGKAGRPQHATA